MENGRRRRRRRKLNRPKKALQRRAAANKPIENEEELGVGQGQKDEAEVPKTTCSIRKCTFTAVPRLLVCMPGPDLYATATVSPDHVA